MNRVERMDASSGEQAAEIRQRLVVWQACVAIILLAIVAAMGRGPWEPDELKYAQIVQGMRAEGEPFVPRLWGRTYTDKPPLYFWLVCLSASLLGDAGLPALLVPIVAAACVGVWMTSHIARRWYGPGVGMLTAVVLASMPLYLVMAQVGRMDMLLALAVTVAVHLCYVGYVEDRPWARLTAYAAMAVGVLAKGPLGIVFPVTICGAYLWITRRLHRLWCRETVAGVFILAAVLATWLVPAVQSHGPAYLRELLGRQMLQRAVGGVDHAEPIYFYFWVLPILLLPWVVFIYRAARVAWQRWLLQHAACELWLLCWVVVPLVVLTLMREKLAVYLLPAMPPISILIARYWSELLARRERHVHDLRPASVLFVTATLAGLGLIIASRVLDAEPMVLRSMVIGGVLLTGLSVVGWVNVLQPPGGRAGWAFGVLASAAPSGALFLALVVLPPLDHARSWRAVADTLQDMRGAGELVITYRLRPYVGYHLPQVVREFRKPDGLTALVEAQGSACCVVRTRHVEQLRRHCVVESIPGSEQSDAAQPICVVRLRPLTVAAQEPHGLW